MPYSIFLRPAAIRDLNRLPEEIRTRIETAIDRLSENPRPPASKKLVGFESEWRLRIRSYGVLYVIDDSSQTITIARVAHRCEAYR